jgi:hypothetical protein
MTYFLVIYCLPPFYDSVLQSGEILNFHFFCEQVMDYTMQNISVLILIINKCPLQDGTNLELSIRSNDYLQCPS